MTDIDEYIALQLAFGLKIAVAVTAGAFVLLQGVHFFRFLHQHNPLLLDMHDDGDEKDAAADASCYVSPVVQYANKYIARYEAAPDQIVVSDGGDGGGDESERRRQLINNYISDYTPSGSIFMCYSDETGAFEYYGSNTAPTSTLESLARKYVLTFQCKPVFVSGRKLPQKDPAAQPPAAAAAPRKFCPPPRERGGGGRNAPPPPAGRRGRIETPIKDTVACNVYIHRGQLRDFHPTTIHQPTPAAPAEELTFEQWQKKQQQQQQQQCTRK